MRCYFIFAITAALFACGKAFDEDIEDFEEDVEENVAYPAKCGTFQAVSSGDVRLPPETGIDSEESAPVYQINYDNVP